MLLTLAGVLARAVRSGGHARLDRPHTRGTMCVGGITWPVMLKQLPTEPIRRQAWGGVSSSIVLIPISLLLEKGQWIAMGAAGWHLVAALLFPPW